MKERFDRRKDIENLQNTLWIYRNLYPNPPAKQHALVEQKPENFHRALNVPPPLLPQTILVNCNAQLNTFHHQLFYW